MAISKGDFRWNRPTSRQVAPGAGALRGPLSRECPKCGAQPGHSCKRYIPARVRGEDIGGGYTRTLAQPHADRKTKRKGGAS